MLPAQPNPTCHYCHAPTVYRVVFRDDDEEIGTCRAHFADAYDAAEVANTQSFLPVHVSRVAELVAA